MTNPPQQMIGKYRVISSLASGSQGAVYRAYDPGLDRYVALKVLHPHLAADPDIVRRFQREARIVASISHPNIVAIAEIGEHEGSHFIAIEYVPHTVRELIDRGPLDITLAVSIAHQAALALEAARANGRGVTHHDIKPDNLLLTALDADGVVKLTDFGIAHASDMTSMTQTGSQWGTPFYMPPEQWTGERGDTRSDIYSLGVVIYQMLAGRAPFDSTASNTLARQHDIARQHLEAQPASLRSMREDIPEDLQAIVEKCMAKSPEDRYQTPGELADALAAMFEPTAPSAPRTVSLTPPAQVEGPPVQPPPARISDVPQPPRRNRLPLIIAGAGGFGAIIVIAIIAIVASLPGENDSPPALPIAAIPVSTPTPTITPAPTDTPTPIPDRLVTAIPAASMNTPVLAPIAVPTDTPTITPTRTPRPIPPTPTFTPTPVHGGRIAFSSNRDENDDIYVMNADGSNVTRLTNSAGRDEHPSWSPDGGRIAFVSDRDGNRDIYVMNADGSNVTRLTNSAGWDEDPSWSPDGGRIAFSSDRDAIGYPERGFGIYVMNADGLNVTRLTTNNKGRDKHPSWSPDGGRIAFSSTPDLFANDIYVMNADGSNVTRLTNSADLDEHPSWSPDGGRIAFSSNRYGNGDIYVMNADGSNVTRLTNSAGWDERPSWNPSR